MIMMTMMMTTTTLLVFATRCVPKRGSRSESWSFCDYRIQWNVLGQTAKVWRSSNIPTELTPSPCSGCCWYLLSFGSTKPTATPWKIGDSVPAWIVVKPRHLDASVCPRTFHWTVQGHLHIRRHDLGKCGRLYLSLNIPAGCSSITVCVERINNRRTIQRFLSCYELRTMASRATFIFWRQYSETSLLQIVAADI